MKTFLHGCLLCFLFAGDFSSSEPEEPPVKVSAVLDGEVTFHVQIRDRFGIEDIYLFFGENVIAKMTISNNFRVQDERFAGRLSTMDDNGSIQLRKLTTEDSGLYTVQIFNHTNGAERERKVYALEIFDRVRPKIIISSNSVNGTCNLTLNCTVEDEKGVSYQWSGENAEISLEPVLNLTLTESESNQTACCTVKNPVSNASDCIHIRTHCFQGSAAPTSTCGFPERIIVCAAATAVCAVVLFILY